MERWFFVCYINNINGLGDDFGFSYLGVIVWKILSKNFLKVLFNFQNIK